MFAVDNLIDVPFNCRHKCWFCGEPMAVYLSFPHHNHVVLDCSHPKLSVPCCTECYQLALKAKVEHIWHLQRTVKQQLVQRYQKDLAIGLNWTEETLANSEFEGGNFEGFKRSAWFIFEVAKARVNFSGWPLVIDGMAIEQLREKSAFVFDGVSFPDIDQAIEHYVKVFNLNKSLLRKALVKVGLERFADAVRFCRIQVDATPQENQMALRVLR